MPTGDVSFANNSVLLHFDGTDGSTSIVDSGPSARTFTAYGDAQISTTGAMFGTGSLLLDGSGDYVGCAASTDFAFPGDFTIEFVAKKTGNGMGGYDTVATTDTSNGSGVNGWILELSSSRGLFFGADGSTIAAYSTNPNDGVAHHWAICRSGSTVRAFKDGAVVYTGTFSGSINGSGNFGVGRNTTLSSYPFAGRIDEFRIKKGVALYTSSFTPPTEPHPDTGALYALSGNVKDATGANASRVVVAISETTKTVVGTTASDGSTGNYNIVTADDEPHTLVFYPGAGENLPALVLREVIPL